MPGANAGYKYDSESYRYQRETIDRGSKRSTGRLEGRFDVQSLRESMGKSYALTIVERKPKFAMTVKPKRKTTTDVVSAMHSCLSKCPNLVVHTITCDGGKEFSKHDLITRKWKTKVYFAIPPLLCERGLVEHHNGLLR